MGDLYQLNSTLNLVFCQERRYNEVMKISHGTRINEYNEANGYGYATINMINSLQRLGHEVNRNDSTADVEIWFDQPHHWKFSRGPYKIGYHPWESTLLKSGWADIMNQCDEIWTPSPLIAEWYQKYAGIKVPVYVYEHGVDPIWTPKTRPIDGPMQFLHVGAEAVRKGGRMTMEAFRHAFKGVPDVELNMKVISKGWNVDRIGRANIINKKLELEELIQMFHDNHVFVYPSWGEGFGLNPLQAMATGMPTITVPAWAPYAQFLDPKLSVSSSIIMSPWQNHHPGKVLQPSKSDLIESMRYAYYNYEDLSRQALDKVAEITAYYDWDRLTNEAFSNLEIRLQNL